MTKYRLEYMVDVLIEINDDNVITRVLENHDDAGVPQPRQKGGTGWRDTLYDLDDRDAVLDMLGYNLGLHDRDLNQLDGWADMPNTAATGRIADLDLISIEELA